jgi:hypothetical protein
MLPSHFPQVFLAPRLDGNCNTSDAPSGLYPGERPFHAASKSMSFTRSSSSRVGMRRHAALVFGGIKSRARQYGLKHEYP